MAMQIDELISEVLALPHHEKVQLLDAILLDLGDGLCIKQVDFEQSLTKKCWSSTNARSS